MKKITLITFAALAFEITINNKTVTGVFGGLTVLPGFRRFHKNGNEYEKTYTTVSIGVCMPCPLDQPGAGKSIDGLRRNDMELLY